MRVSGRTLSLDDLGANNNNNDNNNDNNQQENVYTYHGDTESDYGSDEEDEEEYNAVFIFAKNVQNPQEILTGPISVNSQPNYYLREIELATDTQCYLTGREMKISGSNKEDVDDAVSRFKTLQTLYKRKNKPTDVIACVSPPPEKMNQSFGLYFANLECYRHQDFIFIPGDISNNRYHVLLPVYKDREGRFKKPTDLIDNSQLVYRKSPPGIQIKQQRQQGPPSQRMQQELPQQTWGQNRYVSPAPSASEQWKEQIPIRPTSVASSSSSHSQNYSHGYSYSFTPNGANSSSSQDDFPSLPMKSAKKPTVQSPGKEMKRRVLRINNQKASSVDQLNMNTLTLGDPCCSQSLYDAKEILTKGLNHARGFRGKVKFGTKLGHVLWSNITPSIQEKIWEYNDIKSILMKEKNAWPFFNYVTTTNDNLIEKIKEHIPASPSKTVMFEIHAKARNQPALPYQDIIITINPGAVDIKEVILRRDHITQVNMVSLDREFDYQMYLNVEELGRKDVKPFSTFLKTLSIDIRTMQFSYENIPDFLQVTHVYFKQTSKFKLHFPFVAEITSVERIPSVPQKAIGYISEKLMATPGSGYTWYDFEIFYSTNNEFFKSNLDLSAGKLAPWTVDDILGYQGTNLHEYIKCLVHMTNNIHELIENDDE
ncbi:hypothetical protein BJ944DRAFT_157056 [Cunninghamella echinulata]|nr:hypothetical protein BJ944DRAFT_157056 [Cunninghamella echinulata]